MGTDTTLSLSDVLGRKGLIGFLPARADGQDIGPRAKAAFVGEAGDVQVAVSNTNPTPDVGQITTITVDVGNVSQFPFTENGVVVQDILPDGLTFVSASSSTGTYDPSTGNWTSSVGIPQGGTQSFSIEARATAPGTYTDTATLVSASTDGNASNNSASTTVTVACFTTGTLIRALRNGAEADVAVEALEVGDRVITASGASRPIRWLGHRTIDCRRHPRPGDVLPIRIAAEAFGANQPARDLYVSPGHAVCVDVLGEVLIPAVALVNGSSVRQVEIGSVTYWHVELDSHDVILAEGLPAESYLDTGNRGFFAQEGVVALGASPDAPAADAPFCRPYIDRGPALDAVRARLQRRPAALDAKEPAERRPNVA